MPNELDSAVDRLFFAAFPPPRLRIGLHALARGFTERGGGRPTPAINIHLTLQYLGEVPVELRDTLTSLARQLSTERFTLNFRRYEVWCRGNLLVCTAALPSALNELVHGLRSLVTTTGLTTESRPYRPHLTIARKVAQSTPLPTLAPQLRWAPLTFALCRSRLELTGARYSVLEEFPLGGNT